uniref:DUF2442 domain-containing protein n=1 Tax=uncultured Sphingomonas sp. TaxID=158754 RepID=UPI0035CC69A8
MAGGEYWDHAREDRSAQVMPPIVSRSPWRVTDLQIIEDRAMKVCFVDGLEGIVRFTPGFFRGVFAHLVDAARFREARVDMGAVTWPGELDLAPDRMHHDIRDHGECVLP